jgi:hypothetical protein
MNDEIRLHVTAEKMRALTWDDIETLENPGEALAGAVRSVMAQFMVDEQQQPLPLNQAKKMLGRLHPFGEDGAAVIRDLYQKIREFTLPPASGGG